MNDELLKLALSAAVPLWIARVRNWPEKHKAERARICGQAVAEHGDVIMWAAAVILGVTAHRSGKLALAAYKLALDGTTQTLEEKVDWLLTCVLRPARVLTGMALGGDQLVARVCERRHISFTAYVPCDGQEALWPAQAQQEYRRLLSVAESVLVVRTGPYSALKMQLRNEKIVDDCTDLLALYDGSKGGTFNTVKYALEQQRHTYRLRPDTLQLDEWCAP